MTIFFPSWGFNPSKRGHEFYNFNRWLHRQHNQAFSIFPTCVGLERNVYIFLKYCHLILLIWPNIRCPRADRTKKFKI